jgi:phage portal protein BeeE
MAFLRKVNKAAISPAPPAKAAAAGGVNWYNSNNAGLNMIGQYYSYVEGDLRNRFMQVPTVSRARDLHASILSTLDLKMYRRQWNGEEMEEIYLEPRSWLAQLDPEMPNSYLWSWILDDLLFFGRAFLYITARTTDGYMAQATRLPAGSVTTEDMAGPVWFGKSKSIYFQGGEIDYRNVVQIISPLQGIIYSAYTALETALQIEAARSRNASSAIPAGVLKQTGGEPLSAAELQDLAAAFNAARQTNQTAALNEFLTYEPSNATPDKMLLIESSNYSALEMARVCNVPPYLVGVSTGSYSYQSSEQSRRDLWLFGTSVYARCIEDALSQQLPRGTFVEFDAEDYLLESELPERGNSRPSEQPEENTQEELA